MNLDRILKREPTMEVREKWEGRTYPCRRWFCFRRSPAWRSYERGGRSYCDRHVPRGGGPA